MTQKKHVPINNHRTWFGNCLFTHFKNQNKESLWEHWLFPYGVGTLLVTTIK